MASRIDISALPPPPQGAVDISSLPPPPADISALPPPPPEMTANPEKEKKQWVQPEEAAQIAAKYGVDSQKLAGLAPYYDVNLLSGNKPSIAEAAEFGAKSAAGELGRDVFLGAPQFAYKKLALNENERRALDELRELSESRKSNLERVTEIGRGVVAPIAGAGKLVPKALGRTGRIAEATGIGSAASTFSSREGEEAEAAKSGALLGAGLGVFGEALSKILGPVESRLVETAPKNRQLDIQKGAEELAQRNSKSEGILDDLLMGQKTSLNGEDTAALVREQIPAEKLEAYMDPSTPEGRAIRDRINQTRTAVGPDIEESIQRELAGDVIERRAKDLAEELDPRSNPKSLQDAYETIHEYTARNGNEYVAQRYRDLAETQTALRYLEESGNRVSDQHGAYSRAANFISDPQFVLQDIDNRNGTTVQQILRSGNKDYNKSTFALKEFRGRLQDVFDRNHRLGVDTDIAEGEKLYRAMQSPELAKQLTKQERDAAVGIRAFFDDFLDFANEKIREKAPGIAPMSIPKLEHYLPRYAKPTREIIPIVENQWQKALQESSQAVGRPLEDLSQLTPKEFAVLSEQPGALKNAREYVEWGNQRAVRNGGDLNARLHESLYSRPGRQALEITAKSALERTGNIPDFLLEKNIYKLMDMYTANTIRAMYLRRTIDQLRNQSKVLEKAGADVDAQYVRNLIQDIQGVRKGTAAETNRNIQTNYIRKLDSLIDRAGGPDTRSGAVLTAAKAVPELVRETLHQIYPAMLGFNIRSALQNLTGAVTKLAPEMGGAYGYSTMLKAAVKSALHMREDLARVREMGNLPAGFVREGEAAVAEGLMRSSLYRLPKKAIDGLSEASMALHQLSESFNRVLTLNAGEIMAAEIRAGSPAARKALSKFPRSIQREVLRNPEMSGQILAEHLNDVTQYNYNRLSMSEFGRTMGPMFSVFSKWPSATVGDILATYRERGALRGSVRNAEKYLVSPLLLYAVSSALFGQKDISGEGLSDREKLLIGSKGLAQAAPVGNILSLAKGEVGIPPAVAIAYHGIVKPLLEGRAPSARKTAAEATQTFMPLSGPLRFITSDLVTLATGHKPTGEDFFEKTAQGMDQINKGLK